MARRIVIAPHLPVAELEQRYRRDPDPVASRHWQLVWLLAQGRTGQEVAASTGYSTRWIGQLAQRYNADGPAGLGDHRHQNPAAARVPDGLHLVPLPPYSPELQPAERLWPLVDEPLANRAFDTLAALDTVLGDRCVYLADHPEVVRGYTAFHWWPRARPVPEAITPS